MPSLAHENKKATLPGKAACIYFFEVYYLLDNQSFTISGGITDSTKVYAPDFGDFTIFMALVNRFDEDCSVATVFFAMIPYFISLCTVIFLRTGLNFFNSIRSGEFFLFFVVIYRDVPGMPEFLCSVHSRITCTLFPFFAMMLLL